jgi:hypothetical protein
VCAGVLQGSRSSSFLASFSLVLFPRGSSLSLLLLFLTALTGLKITIEKIHWSTEERKNDTKGWQNESAVETDGS